MHGEDPQLLGALVATELAACTNVSDAPRTPVDWDEVAVGYVADARLRDARQRYETFIANAPEFAATDWSRAVFDPNRAAIGKVTGWQFGSKGLLASGPTGRGKTRSIAELFRRLACDEGRDVRYFFAGDWFSDLQSRIEFGRDNARGWVEACAERPLVIIDDLGQEAIQTSREDWAKAWLFRFLDLRIARGLPLIVATNLSAREMAAHDGNSRDVRADPLVRRFVDLCDIVRFT